MKIIILSLLTALCYGIVGPVSKVAFNKGMHHDGFTLAYAAGLLSFALVTMSQKGIGAMYPNIACTMWGIAAGVICAFGFKSSAIALATPDALVSVVIVVGASYPLISCLISLPLLGEASRVILPRLACGAILVIGGIYLVSTSAKSAQP